MVETIPVVNRAVGPVPVANTTVTTPQPALADNALFQEFLKNLSATAEKSGNKDLLDQLKKVNPNPTLTEDQVQKRLLARLDPSMRSLTEQVEGIGKIFMGLIHGDLEAEHKANLEKIRESLTKNGVLDSLVKRVVGSFTAVADIFKGLGEQIEALCKEDKEGVIALLTQLLETMKENIKQAMAFNPFLRIAIMKMKNPNTQDLLSMADQKVAAKAPNIAIN